MKPLFQNTNGTIAQILILIIFSISLMMVDHRFKHLESVRSGISLALSPLKFLVTAPSNVGNWISNWFTSHRQLQEENQKFRANERLLNAKLQKLQILVAENDQLKKLLGSARKLQDEVIVAELVSVDLNPYRQLIEINKGSADGVHVGQAVIDDKGVMGQIIHLYHSSATVMLISDPEHAIPLRFIRSGIRTIGFGSGNTDQLELKYLPATAEIKVGDVLVTSGLDGRFPADYPVALVSEIKRKVNDGFISAIAKPTALLNSSREVLVIQPSALPTL